MNVHEFFSLQEKKISSSMTTVLVVFVRYKIFLVLCLQLKQMLLSKQFLISEVNVLITLLPGGNFY